MQVGYSKGLNRKRDALFGAYTAKAHFREESFVAGTSQESKNHMLEVQATIASSRLNINLN